MAVKTISKEPTAEELGIYRRVRKHFAEKDVSTTLEALNMELDEEQFQEVVERYDEWMNQSALEPISSIVDDLNEGRLTMSREEQMEKLREERFQREERTKPQKPESFEDLEIEDMELSFGPEVGEKRYVFEFDNQSEVRMMWHQTEEGVDWDWEICLGGASFSGKAKDQTEALAKVKNTAKAFNLRPIRNRRDDNVFEHDQTRTPYGRRSEAARKVPKGAEREASTPSKDLEEAKRTAKALASEKQNRDLTRTMPRIG